MRVLPLRFAVGSVALGAVFLSASTGAGQSVQGQVQKCGGKKATRVGTARNDTINGTRRADVIVALGGNDTVNGRGGNDRICLGGGNDSADGGAGNDLVQGGPGRDAVQGGLGNDRLAGESGNDFVVGGSIARAGAPNSPGPPPNDGDDLLTGGPGADDLLGGTGANRLNGGPGKDGCANGNSGTGAPSLRQIEGVVGGAEGPGCEGQPTGAPVMTPIEASFSPPTTVYNVTARDPLRRDLRHIWIFRSDSVDEACQNNFNPQAPRRGDLETWLFEAEWVHPHPPCPEEPVHFATVELFVATPSVVLRVGPAVLEGEYDLHARYIHGSAPGTGTAPHLSFKLRRHLLPGSAPAAAAASTSTAREATA